MKLLTRFDDGAENYKQGVCVCCSCSVAVFDWKLVAVLQNRGEEK